MASNALVGLLAGLAEVDALQRANPTPQKGGGFTRPEVVRALGRAGVILLSGHFERYLYAINEEGVEWILERQPNAERLPLQIRLIHARRPIDELAATNWDNREEQLRAYSDNEAALWVNEEPVTRLAAERLLAWMKTPRAQAIVRFFSQWGIPDVFTTITNTALNRQRLWLRISELVDKRNNIAHGDLTVEARYLDVVQYEAAVRKFCSRVDRRMARIIASITDNGLPW